MAEPGNGRIPVLVQLDPQRPLVESAMAFRERRAPTIDLGAARVPPGVAIDPTFPAVPVGSARPEGMSLRAVEPRRSEQFVVRAYVEAADLSQIPREIDGRPVYSDTVIAPLLTCGVNAAVGVTADVAAKLNVAALAANGLDGDKVAVAVVDSGINLAHIATQRGSLPRFDASNSWTPGGVRTLPGQHGVGHGTMCAYNVLVAAPKATLLDYAVLMSRAPGGSTAAATVSVALLAYAHLISGWAVAFAAGGPQKYNALVVNNSWGVYHPSWDFPPGHRGRYIDNPNHPFNLIVSTLARAGADIIFAAGNCGLQCPSLQCQNRTTETIMGANAHGEVLTLAGCDTADARVGYSSQGPSIANMPQQKPDLTAYTHFLGSEALGKGDPDTGTSTACPVAAGCVAALRTKESPFNTPPANLFNQLRATARQVAGPAGWNADYGHGIINPVAAAQTIGII